MESEKYKENLTRYPFLSSSPKLIEYFAIIGYQEGVIDILSNEKNTTSSKYSPTIISSVTSKDNENENWSNAIILNQIYPINPCMEFCDKEPTSKMFCISFDSAKGDNKMMIVCYAYLFYELVNAFYFPKAYCIISQYPFFNTFKSLCYVLHYYYKSYFIFPIEYIVTSIVNYYPSPINFSMEYFFFDKLPPIKIPKLSGYPYVDFNLVALFYHIPLQLMIEIYLLTIIECNMVFFSSENEEILNLIMYIFSILNFPCNDSNYFWHIVSISKENFLNASSSSQFTSKLYSTISGVYASYDEIAKEIKATKETQFIIVDLDNKKILHHYNKKSKKDVDTQQMKQLLPFINKIAKDRNVNSVYLKKTVTQLANDINAIIEKTIMKEETSFFKYDEKVALRNRNIQLAFYEFYLNFLTVFYKENQLKTEFEIKEKDVIKKKNTFSPSLMSVELDSKKSKELSTNPEDIFSDEFKSTFKYTFFFFNFIQVSRCQDTYRIPLVFSEEFLVHQETDREKEKKEKEKDKKDKEDVLPTTYFDIMDHFYKVNKNDFKKIDWKEMHAFTVTDKRFYNMNQLEFENENKRLLPIHLNRKTILNFISYCNTLPKETFDNIFPFYSNITNQPIAVVPSDSIVYLTEEKYYQMKKISSMEILLSSFIYLLGMIGLTNKNRLKILNESKEIIKQIQYFKRKYISIVLKYMDLIMKNIDMNREESEVNDDINNLAVCYFPLFNSFRNAKMIPNEEMMTLLILISPQVKKIENYLFPESYKIEDRNSLDNIINSNKNSRSTLSNRNAKSNTETPVDVNCNNFDIKSKSIEGNQKELTSTPDIIQSEISDSLMKEKSFNKNVSINIAFSSNANNNHENEIEEKYFIYNNIIKQNGTKVKIGKNLNDIIFFLEIKDKNKQKIDDEIQLFKLAVKERNDCFIVSNKDDQATIALLLRWMKHNSKIYSPMKLLNSCRRVSLQITNNKPMTETEKDIFNDLLLNFLFYTKYLGFKPSQVAIFEKDILHTFIINNFPQ